MKRLTYDFEIGGKHCWQVEGADNLECREVCRQQEENGCKDCPIAKAFDRLAAIEDILGDEYDLNDLQKAMWCMQTMKLAFADDTASIERLRELWFADRDGRCVVLPAKTVFELVWCAGDGCNLACPVSIDGKGCCDFCDHGTIIVEEVPCRQEHIERIGVDVFLTRTEAMAALRREQDG